MTPQARASAIRDQLTELDVHINSLIDDGYNVVLNQIYADNRRKHMVTRLSADKRVVEKL
jgi:hypothetical protein